MAQAAPRPSWHPVQPFSVDWHSLHSDLPPFSSYQWERIDAQNTGGNCGLQSICQALQIPWTEDTFDRMRRQILQIRLQWKGDMIEDRRAAMFKRLRTSNELLYDDDLALLCMGTKMPDNTDIGFGVIPIICNEQPAANPRPGGPTHELSFLVSKAYRPMNRILTEQSLATPFILLKNESRAGGIGRQHWVCFGVRENPRTVRTVFFPDELPPAFLTKFYAAVNIFANDDEKVAFIDIYNPVQQSARPPPRPAVPSPPPRSLPPSPAIIAEPSTGEEEFELSELEDDPNIAAQVDRLFL